MTQANDTFTKVEAINISYKQTREGDVISFRIHPEDRNNDLANTPLGTRMLLAVAEIKDE